MVIFSSGLSASKSLTKQRRVWPNNCGRGFHVRTDSDEGIDVRGQRCLLPRPRGELPIDHRELLQELCVETGTYRFLHNREGFGNLRGEQCRPRLNRVRGFHRQLADSDHRGINGAIKLDLAIAGSVEILAMCRFLLASLPRTAERGIRRCGRCWPTRGPTTAPSTVSKSACEI